MSSLLLLPREIREQILSYVILHKDEGPRNLQELYKRADLDDGFRYFSRSMHHGIKWPSSQAHLNICTNPLSLLRTNKLLRDETLYIISQQRPKAQAGLDILIANEDELWPTWTYVPAAKFNRPEIVNVTIRTCGIAKAEHSGFEEEAGLVTLWRFSSILERILRCGWAMPQSADSDEDIHLDALNLNFLSPNTADGPIMAEAIAPHWAQQERHTNPKGQIHPGALAMSLANWIAVMLQYRSEDMPFMNDPHDLLNLVNRVSIMRFMVDGVLRHTEVIHPLRIVATD